MGSQDLALCPLPSLNAKCVVIVDNLRSAFNVGSIFRTSECVFGTVASIVLTGYTVCMCMCVCLCVCVCMCPHWLYGLSCSLSLIYLLHTACRARSLPFSLARALPCVFSREFSPAFSLSVLLACFFAHRHLFHSSGVAIISRLLKNTSLLCKISSLL